MIKKVAGYFYYAYVGLVFIITLIIGYIYGAISIAFGNEATLKRMHHLPGWMCSWVIRLAGVKVNKHNFENVDPEAQYVIICNHRSFADVLVLRSVIPNYVKYLAKASIGKVPFMRFFFKHFAISVDRTSKEDRKASMQKMMNAVKDQNASVVIYPEGTRNTTKDHLLPFKNGAFNIAAGAGIPVLVITLKNITKIQIPGTFRAYPGTVECFFDGPLDPEMGAEKLKEESYKIMMERLS